MNDATPPRAKGPLVFLDYDQAELDAAYDQAAYEANLEQMRKRWAGNSARTRARIGEPMRRAYGGAEIEKLDIFRTDRATGDTAAPVFVFLHGGAWRRGTASDYSAPAEMFVRAGVHYVVPDFSWVQDCGGDLLPIADQICRAIAWVHRSAASFGGDPDRLYIGGHSSGAHMAAVALTADWARDYDAPADIVKGGMCSSGMYELAPVRLSHRASYVKFTDATVEQLSPMRHLDRLSTPLIVSYGSYETPEFIRQARDFAAAVRDTGKPVELIVGENFSHMETPETLCNPCGLLGAAVLKMMGLGEG
jgi:arylformamidase